MTNVKPQSPRSREAQAMQTIIETLEPLPAPTQAKVLLAAALLSTPKALTEQQVLALWRMAQAKP